MILKIESGSGINHSGSTTLNVLTLRLLAVIKGNFGFWKTYFHWPNNFKDTKPAKCHLYWCIIEFRDWRYSQSCCIFDPSCELAPLYLFSSSPAPLPVGISTGLIQCVTRGRRSGCVESIYRSYTPCIWPDSEPAELLNHRKQKSRRGGGLRQINTCRQVPSQVNF